MTDAPTLIDSIRLHAEQTPDAPAIGSPERRPLSYANLWQRIAAMVDALQVRSLTGDKTIAIALPDGPELAVSFLIISAVAKCLILNPRSRSDEFKFYLSDLNPQALIVQSKTACEGIAVAHQRGVPVFEIFPVLHAEAGVFEMKASESAHSAERLFRNGDDVGLQIYTSGTTAKPKAVSITHNVIREAAANVQRTLQLTASDRCLNVMPMFHVHALILATAGSLLSGGSVIFCPGFDAGQFFDWIERTEPTWYTAAPPIHQAVLQEAEYRKIRSVPLRFIRSSASALLPRLMNQMEDTLQVPVVQAYGMTESPLIAANPLPPGLRKPGSVGLPAGPQLRIAGENGVALRQGETGEIMIRGACVVGDQNRWFRTGDTGYLDEDGYLFLTGRLKEVINRGGQKISPLEVDSVLLQHPSVADAAAFGFAHGNLGEEIAAAVVLRKNAQATERELRDYVLGKLTDYKIPRHVVITEGIPRNATGKILRHELALEFELSLKKRDDHREPVESIPSNSVENRLRSSWIEVLQIPSVGINDDFFRLGGDSIRATLLVSRIRKVFGVQLPLRSLFDAPTIAEISQQILGENAGVPEPSMISYGVTPEFCEGAHPRESVTKSSRPMEFSLFFFSADASISDDYKYRLLLESARFADRNGFAAIWTPERHFHAFGGLYPNPSVLSAALAMITSRIQIRAGSVVLPLQDPVRVAEEWSVVDNLSNGRVAISCASGWHANDFTLSPENYSNRRKVMYERIEIIQKLWRGETILLPNGAGNLVKVGIFPKPLQPRLPLWLSCHSDETFRNAGKSGFNVVTTLYNSTMNRLAEQITLYKKTLLENDHDPEARSVTLMLHTFVAENKEAVINKVKSAYSDYLLTFLGLQREQAQGQDYDFDLTEADRTFLLSRSIDRLYEVRDLVGTPETCTKKVEALSAIGVNEIACLIDFGIDFDSVMAGLDQLNKLRLITSPV